jgi:electron transport complex protein RnfG
MKNGFIGQSWLVLALAVGFGGALAGVETALREPIRVNQENETYDQIPNLVKITDPQTHKELVADKAKTEEWVSEDEKVAYKVFTASGTHIGWVIRTAGQGFADKIELLVGLDVEAKTITGLFVLAQKETPGLGNKIEQAKWRVKFEQKEIWDTQKDALSPLLVTQDAPKDYPNRIEPVSGATISSRSVCETVNRAVKDFRARRGELKRKDKD